MEGLKKCVGDGQDHLSIDVLRVALAQDEWLSHIKNWRRNDGSGLVEILRYNDQGAVGGLDRTGLPPEPESTGWQSAA